MSEFKTDINYLKKAAEQTRAVKELTYELLDLNRASDVLDVGCGPGVDTVEMGKRSSPDTRITGLDIDSEMLLAADEVAKNAQSGGKVRHIRGSALNLPFDDQSFDRIRAERFFQVISPETASEESILGELLRVLKPGGIIVLADTDWATASVDFSDDELERRMIRFFADVCRPNGYAGRRFYRRLKEMGLTQVDVSVIPISMHTFTDEDPLALWLTNEATEKGVISKAEAELWLGELKAKSGRGEYFAVANMNVVRGVKNM